MPEFTLISHANFYKDNLYKEDWGYYDYDTDTVYVNLYLLEGADETETISLIANTIEHEYIHAVIWNCRKNLQDIPIFNFFEEKIVCNILGEEFDDEDYYELVQIDE